MHWFHFTTRLSVIVALASAFLSISYALCVSPVQADVSSNIQVQPGPTGEIRISTPWGDYVTYDKGAGNYWVGTQSEFDRTIRRSNAGKR